ncbi:hypothetical protein ACTXT7_003902 [Hymenolepis weldensis]
MFASLSKVILGEIKEQSVETQFFDLHVIIAELNDASKFRDTQTEPAWSNRSVMLKLCQSLSQLDFTAIVCPRCFAVTQSTSAQLLLSLLLKTCNASHDDSKVGMV